mmetsp:Transcript_12706/g.54389  ORF Transcript_12706/g.54389 Transcript_12706/m.54389 type:complete len:251 (-) Transcript_12706:3130-3882(-)
MLHRQTGLRLAALGRRIRERTLPNRVVIAHARPVILARSVHARRAFRRAVAPAAELDVLRPVRLLVVQRKFGILRCSREALRADNLGGPGHAVVVVPGVLHRAHAVFAVVRERTGVRARRAGPPELALARHRGPADTESGRGTRVVDFAAAPDGRHPGLVLLVGQRRELVIVLFRRGSRGGRAVPGRAVPVPGRPRAVGITGIPARTLERPQPRLLGAPRDHLGLEVLKHDGAPCDCFAGRAALDGARRV